MVVEKNATKMPQKCHKNATKMPQKCHKNPAKIGAANQHLDGTNFDQWLLKKTADEKQFLNGTQNKIF
jgi:hypothetical protein